MSGGSVPHFVVRTLDGHVVDYAASVWQRSNLVLVVLPSIPSESAQEYATRLRARADDFRARSATCVVTRDAIDGVPPGVLVADEWGEIVYGRSVSAIEALPDPGELLDWLDYIEQRCPECEGEAR